MDRLAASAIPTRVSYAGFWWRIEAREKVLMYAREPVGGVRHSARRYGIATPWNADRLAPAADARFARESEAIAFVEGAIRPYGEWKAFVTGAPRRSESSAASL